MIEMSIEGCDTYITIPEDSGRAWFNVFVAGYINFLLTGITISHSIFSTSIAQSLHFSQQHVLLHCILFLGPLCCALANIYCLKILTFLGSIIVIICFGVSYFLQNEIGFIVIFSVCGGFGASLLYTVSLLSPNYWFCNKRAFACCLSYVGTSFAIILMPSLVALIFENLLSNTWTSITIFYAGLTLPLLLLPLAMAPMKGIHVEVHGHTSERKVRFHDEMMALRVASSVTNIPLSTSFKVVGTFENLKFPRVIDIVQGRVITVEVPKMLHYKCLDSTWHQHHSRQSSVSIGMSATRDVEVVVNRHKRYRGARPLYRTDIFYSWNVLLLNYYYKQDTQLDYHMAVTRAISHQDLIQEGSWRTVCKEGFTRAFLTMFHVTVLSSFSYLTLLLVLGLLFASILTPFIFIEDRAVEMGFPQKDAYAMLFFAGFGSLFGILLSAVFAVFSFNNDYEGFLTVILISGGVFCVLSNIIVATHYQMVYALMIGTIIGLVRALTPAVIYNIVGLEDLTNLFGYGLIVEGLGTMGGPLLAAYYVEKWKSARQAFICTGIFLVAAGILLPFVKYLKTHSRERMSIII